MDYRLFVRESISFIFAAVPIEWTIKTAEVVFYLRAVLMASLICTYLSASGMIRDARFNLFAFHIVSKVCLFGAPYFSFACYIDLYQRRSLNADMATAVAFAVVGIYTYLRLERHLNQHPEMFDDEGNLR